MGLADEGSSAWISAPLLLPDFVSKTEDLVGANRWQVSANFQLDLAYSFDGINEAGNLAGRTDCQPSFLTVCGNASSVEVNASRQTDEAEVFTTLGAFDSDFSVESLAFSQSGDLDSSPKMFVFAAHGNQNFTSGPYDV